MFFLKISQTRVKNDQKSSLHEWEELIVLKIPKRFRWGQHRLTLSVGINRRFIPCWRVRRIHSLRDPDTRDLPNVHVYLHVCTLNTNVYARVVCLELTLRHVQTDQYRDRARNSNSVLTQTSHYANSDQANCLIVRKYFVVPFFSSSVLAIVPTFLIFSWSIIQYFSTSFPLKVFFNFKYLSWLEKLWLDFDVYRFSNYFVFFPLLFSFFVA